MASANIGGSGGKSGKRSLDAELLLVPFIDLLSMCICFLLITAVWIQIGVLQVKQANGTEVDATSAPLEMDLKFAGPTSFEIQFKKNGRAQKKILLQGATASEALAKLDQGLDAIIQSASGVKIDKATKDLVSAAMVTPKQGVPYGDLVLAMDVLRRHRIVNIGVVPVGGGL
jgi:biopolymer transport protein TolR